MVGDLIWPNRLCIVRARALGRTLGLPVVPDVYTSVARSDGPSAAGVNPRRPRAITSVNSSTGQSSPKRHLSLTPPHSTAAKRRPCTRTPSYSQMNRWHIFCRRSAADHHVHGINDNSHPPCTACVTTLPHMWEHRHRCLVSEPDWLSAHYVLAHKAVASKHPGTKKSALRGRTPGAALSPPAPLALAPSAEAPAELAPFAPAPLAPAPLPPAPCCASCCASAGSSFSSAWESWQMSATAPECRRM